MLRVNCDVERLSGLAAQVAWSVVSENNGRVLSTRDSGSSAAWGRPVEMRDT